MDILFIFIAGIIFISFILPLIDSFLQVICALFELILSYVSVAITKNNYIISLWSVSDDQSSSAIGFDIGGDEEYYDEDEDDYDDYETEDINKNKIGF